MHDVRSTPRRGAARLALIAAAAVTLALAAGCLGTSTLTAIDRPYAGADVAPARGGELRLLRPLPSAGAVGPVIGFPLRHTDVHTRVAGVLAVTTLEQVFENPLAEPTDAVYVFPLGAHAAVSAYRIEVGARVIEGVIQRRAQARATYEAARQEGHTAALLEQVTSNVFSQRLANLAPGEIIKVRFEVTEPLAVRDGQLELVVPLVVGPRYLPATRRGKAPVSARQAGDPPEPGETSIGYVEPAIAGNTISFTAELDLPLAPSAVTSPSHDLLVDAPAPGRTRITLAARGELPNRDLIVRLRPGEARTVLTPAVHRQGDDGYALLTIVPPPAPTRAERTPREIIVLIDRSGSMADGGLDQARAVARAIIAGADEGDTLHGLAFADDVSRLADEPVRADEPNRDDAIRFVEGLLAGGGTPLATGVLAALDEPVTPGRVRAVYLISDGLVGNDDVVVAAARGSLGGNRVYPIGIGAAPNRALIDELARVGRGFPTYVGLTEPAAAIAAEVVARSRAPYLTDVTIDWGGLAVVDAAPSLVPDVHAGLPLAVAVRYTAPGEGVVTVRGTIAGRPARFTVPLVLPARADAPAVRLAWARARVDALTAGEEGARELPAVASAIEALGLRYGLVTRETSFVAVDRTRVVAPGGSEQVIEAPATVPEGVDLERVAPTPPAKTVKRGSREGNAHELGYPSPPSRGFRGGDSDLVTLLLLLAMGPVTGLLRRGRPRAVTLDDLARQAPWTLVLVLVATPLTLLAQSPSSFELVAPLLADRAHTFGEPWRLVSGPLVHASFGHLARDVAMLGLLGLAYEGVLPRWRALVLVGLAVPAAAELAAGASVYLGLSGLTHALLGAALVLELDRRRGRPRAIAIVVAAVVLAKVGFEVVSGQPVFPIDGTGGLTVATLAHGVGLACGALLALVPRTIAPPVPPARARVVPSSEP